MSKTFVRIHHNGNVYRIGKSWKCASKRDCDLFEAGVCDIDTYVEHLPCDAIVNALSDVGFSGLKFGLKKVRK